jgi:hypothetical protein
VLQKDEKKHQTRYKRNENIKTGFRAPGKKKLHLGRDKKQPPHRKKKKLRREN